jgi:phospho-N-acetylmuramoyl-pentapeptide-transferase
MVEDFVKIFIPATAAFFVGMAMTPILTHYLYRFKCWKKVAGKKNGYAGGNTPLFDTLHKDKEVGTPRMGGVVIWGSVLVTIIGIWLLERYVGGALLEKLEFFSRGQTWLPVFALLTGACVGIFDDLLEIWGTGAHFAGGLPLRKRLLAVGAVCAFAGWWFYEKLGVTGVSIPFDGVWELGILFIPFFVLVGLAVYAGGVIDGIDGLAGGVFIIMFSSYGIIAFAQNQIDLATFCATVVGGLLAFLWFNIPPARFYMSETGVMGLTLALTITAFMTDTLAGGKGVAVLPLVALPLVITVASDVIQVFSKRFRKKKVFLIAPLHHHFEAIGWPPYKVTMRYWVASAISAFLGVIVALSGTLAL